MWYHLYGPRDWVIFSLLCVFILVTLAQLTPIWRPGFRRGSAAILLPLLACLALAYWPWEPVLREHVLPIKGLQRSITIAHLSDVHLTCLPVVGWHNRRSAERGVALVEQIDPDLVVLTGDYVHMAPDYVAVGELLGPLGERWPTFAVLGNHDFWEVEWPERARGGRGEVTTTGDWARLLNARLLRNEARPIAGGRIWIIGVDDPATGRDDITRAMRGVPDDAVKIVIAHSPDIFRKAARARADVLLGGHLHGGQVWLPGTGPVYTHSLLTKRLRRQLAVGCRWMPLPGGERMYIVSTTGLGVSSAAPVRLGCPAEVAKIVLVPADSPEARQSECTGPEQRLQFSAVLDPDLRP
ncbi:MAG: metallophosphoesterase [Armatimonadota bacterium]